MAEFLSQPCLKSVSRLLHEALAILDQQGLAIAAAHLDCAIQLVDAASLGDRDLVP
jgi:hypothetical protein